MLGDAEAEQSDLVVDLDDALQDHRVQRLMVYAGFSTDLQTPEDGGA